MNMWKRPPVQPASCLLPAPPLPSKRQKLNGPATANFPLDYWSENYDLSLNLYIGGFYLHGLLRFFTQGLLAMVKEQGVLVGNDKMNSLVHDFLLGEWKKGKIRFLNSNVSLRPVDKVSEGWGDPSKPCSEGGDKTADGETHQVQPGDSERDKITVPSSSKLTPADAGDSTNSRDESQVPDVKKVRGNEVCARMDKDSQTEKVCAGKNKASQTCAQMKEVMQQSEQSKQTDTCTVTTGRNSDPCASFKDCAMQTSGAWRQNLDRSTSSQTRSDDPREPENAPTKAAPVQVLGERITTRKVNQKHARSLRLGKRNLVQLTGPFFNNKTEQRGPQETVPVKPEGNDCLPGEDAGHTQRLEAAADKQPRPTLTQLIEHQFDHMTKQATGQILAAFSCYSDETGRPIMPAPDNGSTGSTRFHMSASAMNNSLMPGSREAGNFPPSSLVENRMEDGEMKLSDVNVTRMQFLLDQIQAVASAKIDFIPAHHQHPSSKQDVQEETNSLGVSAEHVKFDSAKPTGHETVGMVADTASSEQRNTGLPDVCGNTQPLEAIPLPGEQAPRECDAFALPRENSKQSAAESMVNLDEFDESGSLQKRGSHIRGIYRHKQPLDKTALLDKQTSGENAYRSPQKTSSSHAYEGRVPSLDEIPLPDEKPRRSSAQNGSQNDESPGTDEVLKTSPEGFHNSSVLTSGPGDTGTTREQVQTTDNTDTKRGQIETLVSQIQMIVGKLSEANVGLSPSQESASPGTSCGQESSNASASHTQGSATPNTNHAQESAVPTASNTPESASLTSSYTPESASPSTRHTWESAGSRNNLSNERVSSQGTPSQDGCSLCDPVHSQEGSSYMTTITGKASPKSPSSLRFLPYTIREKKGIGRKYVHSNHNTDVSKAVDSVIARKIASLICNRKKLSADAISDQCSHLISRCLSKSQRKSERRHRSIVRDSRRKRDKWTMTSRPHCVNRRIMTDIIPVTESGTVTDLVARRDMTTLTDCWMKDAWTTTQRFKPFISRSSQTVRLGVAEVGTGTERLSPLLKAEQGLMMTRSTERDKATKTTVAAVAPTTHHQPGHIIAEQLTTACQETVKVDGEKHRRALVQNISRCVLREDVGSEKAQEAGETSGPAAADQGTVRITIKVKVAKGSNIRLAS